jgi:hypothetical protein
LASISFFTTPSRGGPRESESRGIYCAVLSLLEMSLA